MIADTGGKKTSAQKISELVRLILQDEDFYQCNTAMETLSQILGDITQITVKDDENQSQSTMLKEGHAISPVQAAKCITQITRTRQFWIAIKQAIEEQLSQRDTVNVLYAGTGPYGTILLPLLPFLEQSGIRLVCLDIHDVNTVATKKIIDELNPDLQQLEFVCADATKWQPDSGRQFDIIISETMNAYLHREPQVSIFAHLEQFLAPTGCLIPEEIVVEAWLSNHHIYDASSREMLEVEASRLGELLRLDRSLARKVREQKLETLDAQVRLPDTRSFYRSMELRTDINIYKEIGLTLNQCSLNIPKTIEPVGGFAGNSTIDLTYRIFDDPNWDVQSDTSTWEVPLTAFDATGHLGIRHLHRLWDKTIRIILNIRGCETPQEMPLDLALVNLLGLEFGEIYGIVSSGLPEFEYFEYIIEDKQGKLFKGKVDLINKELAELAENIDFES